MPNGYAKFRRGLVEHLKDGRMTADEYCVFSLLIQLADFHSGVWIGSGVAMSSYTKWCERKNQMVLGSLQSKGYLELRTIPGRKGNYPIVVNKYHGSAHGDAMTGQIMAPGCADEALSPHGETTLKEVIQEKKDKEVRPAHKSRGSHHLPLRPKNGKELEGIMEIITQGPPRKDYLEFLELRAKGKLPKRMTWEKWRDLTPQQKQKKLQAA